MIDKNIGSAKDNMNSTIHNWYKFTAGFSYKFVDVIIEGLSNTPNCIYEPFAGCGTTLVEAQKLGIHSIGNESQKLMCDIIDAKLNWDIDAEAVSSYLEDMTSVDCRDYLGRATVNIHPLIQSLFDDDSVNVIYYLRDYIRKISDEKIRLFLNLALSQALHKIAIHPIAVPYISRSKTLMNSGDAMGKFLSIALRMLSDLHDLPCHHRCAKVYNHDSRKKNVDIASGECDLCITSPPYLNNLDYGEVSKVHTHFFEYTKDWNDITQKVRHDLVTGATTHYKDSEFNLAEFEKSEFVMNNIKLYSELRTRFDQIKENARVRSGKKSFHILMMLYFQDMYYVLMEMRRVLKPKSHAFLILGDSAPYGIHIPTTQFLGEIAQSVGFGDYEIFKIRSRGNKWKSLSNRHNIELSENILDLSLS